MSSLPRTRPRLGPTLACLLAAALTATLEDWKAVAAALPLIWVACSLTWAVRRHSTII